MRNFKLVTCDQTTDEDKLFFSVAKNGFKDGIKFKVEKIFGQERLTEPFNCQITKWNQLVSYTFRRSLP